MGRRAVPNDVRSCLQTLQQRISERIGRRIEYSSVEELMIRAGLQHFAQESAFERLIASIKSRMEPK